MFDAEQEIKRLIDSDNKKPDSVVCVDTGISEGYVENLVIEHTHNIVDRIDDIEDAIDGIRNVREFVSGLIKNHADEDCNMCETHACKNENEYREGFDFGSGVGLAQPKSHTDISRIVFDNQILTLSMLSKEAATSELSYLQKCIDQIIIELREKRQQLGDQDETWQEAKRGVMADAGV